MPQIPTVQNKSGASGSVQGLSPTRTAAGFANAADKIDQYALVVAKGLAEQQRAKDSAHMSRSLLEMRETLAQAYTAAVESPDYETSLERFNGGAAIIGTKLSETFTNEEDMAKFQLAFTREATTMSLQVGANARRLRSAAQMDHWNAGVEQAAMNASQLREGDEGGFETIFDNLRADAERLQAEGKPVDPEVEMQKFLGRYDHYRSSTMSQNDPARLQELLNERNEDDSWANFTHLDPEARVRANQSAITGINTHARIDREEEAAKVKAANQTFYDRTFGDDPRGMPTIAEVAGNPWITNKDSKISMLQRKGTGEFDELTNYGVYRPLFSDASRGVEGVVERAQVAYDRGDLQDQDLRAIEAAFKKSKESTSEEKSNDRLFDKEVERYMKDIAKNSSAGGNDKVGNENATAYREHVRKRWDSGLARGITPGEMSSVFNQKEYIFNIEAWQRGLGAELDDMLSDYGLDSDFEASDPDVGSEEWLQRRPEESLDEWRGRAGPYLK